MASDKDKKIDLSEKRLSDIEDLLKSINDTVSSARVLNRGFDELKDDLYELKESQIRSEMEIKSMRASEATFRQKISDISELLYDPHDGLYKKISENSLNDKIFEEKLDNVMEKIERIEETIVPFEQTDKELKRITGENLQELGSIVKTKTTINKMFWIITTAFLAAAGKLFWEMFSK